MTIPNAISNYEVVSKIGEGGMGEVYRARDKDLGRDVAIKVLPAAFSADTERLRRFEQEAQAAGSLNHPNVLVIYHVGTNDGSPYIVSELLDGETLRDRLNGAALPQRKAIDYALQIAHGLAAAHEKGIIHRDLKPENLFVTKDGRVKILDFGLAKLTQTDSDQPQTNVPTRRVDTEPGMIMGTAGYMSPEQVRGRPVDHRADIFSFGAILYEMLSGKRAFHGESTADTMSAILREDPPDLSQTNKNVAPALERVINHCLEKNPEERFHSANDLAFAIEALSGATSISGLPVLSDLPARRRPYREIIAWAAAAILLLTSLAFAALYLRRPAPDERQVQFVVAMPEKASDLLMPVISPDGRTLAFLATVEGTRYLFVRSLDVVAERRLAGTEDASFPFWSPDSRHIGFFSNNKLRKVEVNGGPVQVLCDAQSATGGTWNRDGVILLGVPNKPIQRVSSAGGQAAQVLALDETRNEIEHSFPQFLPDGNHFLYYSWNGSPSSAEIYVASLDGKDRKGLIQNDSNAVFTAPGYLLFARETTLMAQRFDASKLELTGEAVPVLENVTFSANIAYSNFSVSDNGTLVFWSGTNTGRQLAWFDRSGKQISTVGPAALYNDVVMSPDQKKAAVQKIDGGNSDIWIIDLVRGLPVRFTFNAASDDDPTWSSDGSYVVFTSDRNNGSRQLYKKIASGAGNEELLGDTPSITTDGCDLSSDGKYILFETTGEKTGGDVWVLPLEGDKKAYPLLQSEFNEFHAHFSPDGRWFAYSSAESGKPEVYIQSFPPAGGKWQVSTNGGAQPQWRRDGKELFYVATDRKLMAVDIKLGTSFEMGTPAALFQTQVAGFAAPNRYAVSPDGQRFLINSTIQDASPTPLTVILNWTSSLSK
jgi:Tol biopolymer transport system component